MAPRSELHDRLVGILGSANVYFQPPPSIQMAYPAIVYGFYRWDVLYADNQSYTGLKSYQVTVIDRDPDSPIPNRMWELPYARFERHFTFDNLNHDIFILYF